MKGMGRCFLVTLKACVTNLSCAPFFLVAVLFYAFYYCWPYMAQLPLHIDAVIVDEDRSQLSRALARAIMAEPNYNIIAEFQERAPGDELMRMGRISAIIGIPAGFEKDIFTGIPTGLTVLANGAFIVKAHDTMSGGAGPLSEVAHAAIKAELARSGAGPELPDRSPAVEFVAMYNTISGYLSFAVAIVFVIIFQSLMICGMAMLLNDWFSRPVLPEPLVKALASPAYLLALQGPVFCFCVIWSLFVEGFAFYWQGINSFQNVPATLLVSIFFAWGVSSLGLFTGLAFGSSKFAIHAVVTSSLPCVFISGNLFPWQDIPVYMRALASFIPSTPGVDAMLRASQAGADPFEIFPYLMHLLALGLIYFALAWLVAKKRATQRALPQG